MRSKLGEIGEDYVPIDGERIDVDRYLNQCPTE